MTPQTELEIQGNFFAHPFAELAAEIRQTGLTGSLRASYKETKSVTYFKDGNVVFAVSNRREARLFDILLRRNRLSKDEITKIANFANDLQFAADLQKKGLLDKAEVDNLFTEQIEAIIIDALTWQSGEWTFSSLMRIRDGLAFDVNTPKLLMDYGRCLTPENTLSRFRSMEETFVPSGRDAAGLSLIPEETFVLSRITEPLSAAAIVKLARIPDAKTLSSLYALWMAGLVYRMNWVPTFSQAQVEAMRGARIELKREAKLSEEAEVDVKAEAPEAETQPDEQVFTMTRDDYLDQVENAATFYDVLGVDQRADADELKRAYFQLARNFHPDRYHAEGGEMLKRMQNAFTELAQAHETLKNPELREVYDYKMRKELTAREKSTNVGGDVDRGVLDQERAADNFETGFSLLMDGESEEATAFLARAVHFGPKNPRYRAYYGKALAADKSQRHKAESELQAAISLDPDNVNYKIMLADFFIQFNLRKRAEGELTRLLAAYPSNREAAAMLEKLQQT